MPQPAIIAEFWNTVRSNGLHDGLRFLNGRTPHRCTGIYRYDGDMLRNLLLFDQSVPTRRRGPDVKMLDGYCAVVGERQGPVEFADISEEWAIALKPDSTVVSYCGALIVDDRGEPFGTLCHFDTKPTQARQSDMPILEAIAPLLWTALQAGDAPVTATTRSPDPSTAMATDVGEPATGQESPS